MDKLIVLDSYSFAPLVPPLSSSGASSEGWTAWELTRRISPRDRARVAAVMAGGEVLNDYSRNRWLDDEPPTGPWAMYLAGDDRAYRYLVFDLDAGKGNPVYDAGRLSHWLDALNIDHLVVESGPTGGRHVWIALTDAVTAALVATVAALAAQLLPSLDVTPLNNPATGCVRPPGAPHRLGGVSRPLGPLTTLTTPRTTPEDIEALRDFLIDAGAEISAPVTSLIKGMAIDDGGHPYILGARRPLSARIRGLLDELPAEDASYTLATILAGGAHARWRHADVAALVDISPAFEHVRTLRGRTGRVPRTERGRAAALAAAWRHAVYLVAANPSSRTGVDDDFRERAIATTRAVAAAQERANALPGLWGLDRASSAQRAGGGTYSHRAVLDALSLYTLQSAQLTVEADVRRLSADTGYGRTTVHTALAALSRPTDPANPESAWIVPVGTPEAPHGQRYRLSQQFSTTAEASNRTQVRARPTASHPHDRTHWINRLSRELQLLTRDTFAAPKSLGRTAGLVYKQISEGAIVTIDELTRTTGLDAARTRAALTRLHRHGLVERTAYGWNRTDDLQLDAAALELGVDGYLDGRRERYGIERTVWAWWLAEYGWMTRPGKKRRARRAPANVVLFAQNDRPDYARYPRGPDRRGDHRRARQLVEAGALSPTAIVTAA